MYSAVCGYVCKKSRHGEAELKVEKSEFILYMYIQINKTIQILCEIIINYTCLVFMITSLTRKIYFTLKKPKLISPGIHLAEIKLVYKIPVDLSK